MVMALKLFLTPFFIGMVTLAGRRWGPVISGLLMGMPLTSGPISLILALQYGTHFAAQAAIGTLLGQASVCLFCLAYALTAQRAKWPVSAGVAVLIFVAATAFWNSLVWTLLPAFGMLLGLIALVSWRLPKSAHGKAPESAPRWDLPARMIVATTFVVLLTTVADTLGPQLSGLLSPFPIFSLVLSVFTHQQQGGAAVARLLRGVVVGSLAFGGFFLVTGLSVTTLPLPWTYLMATVAALGGSGLAFILTRSENSIGK